MSSTARGIHWPKADNKISPAARCCPVRCCEPVDTAASTQAGNFELEYRAVLGVTHKRCDVPRCCNGTLHHSAQPFDGIVMLEGGQNTRAVQIGRMC